MDKQIILGIDMGGTQVRAGLVRDGSLSSVISERINAKGSTEEVLQNLFNLSDQLINKTVTAIGIGVPGMTDSAQAIVYDAINIPSWKEVPLRQLMENRYQLPVLINNDANCFALGEFYFGKGRGHNSLIGLTIGTGLGSGIIINKRLYTGKSGGAGEFGMIDYLDKYYEYYASGQFFQNIHGINGELVFHKALKGDKEAFKMYEEMGMHLANAIKTILYAYDAGLIILGGSVRHAFPYFSKAMWEQIQTFAYKRVIDNLKIEISELDNSGILGAAALYYDFNEN